MGKRQKKDKISRYYTDGKVKVGETVGLYAHQPFVQIEDGDGRVFDCSVNIEKTIKYNKLHVDKAYPDIDYVSPKEKIIFDVLVEHQKGK